ncbi:MAG: hypothetical protein K0R84_1998 [Clostridia bacterium]|jgi:hypothetical protein|nr:hypothetical protein [Clostridia bacterium]
MKKTAKIAIILLAVVLAASCSVKQGQLQIIEKHDSSDDNTLRSTSLNFNVMPQKISIEKNAEIIKKLNPRLIPLTLLPESGLIIAMEFIDSGETDEINSKVVTGNMIQPINLYAVDTKANEEKLLGKFMSLKDFMFDTSGKLFAFIDGNSNVYIYDTMLKQLQKIIEGKNYYSYETLSWSKDSKKLLINQKMNYDISSKQIIPFVVDSYSPFIKHKFDNQETYIVQMKNNEYIDMIALYDFEKNSFMNLANGIFLDSDNVNLIYTKQSQSSLNILNLETLESKPMEAGSIYNAKIMKSTGDVIYTTVNPDTRSSYRYILVKVNPKSETKRTLEINTPTFYLSPAEDKIYFVSDYSKNSIVVDSGTMNITQTISKTDDSDLFAIKSTILKMFNLDYNYAGSYDNYELQASKIYANTYDPLPQEALENKLIDFKRFNMPLPTWQKEPVVPPTLVLNAVSIRGTKASVNLGLFFTNSMELTKQGDNWLITGFSTHPDSKEVKDIRSLVAKHINDIKNKNEEEALKFWKSDNISELDEKQIKIVQDLMKLGSKTKIEIGEIELWSLGEPHRAESPQTAAEAKVKIIISDESNSRKYKLILTKPDLRSFTISSWSIDPLSISQLR